VDRPEVRKIQSWFEEASKVNKMCNIVEGKALEELGMLQENRDKSLKRDRGHCRDEEGRYVDYKSLNTRQHVQSHKGESACCRHCQP
jgi:hypothetical protein